MLEQVSCPPGARIVFEHPSNLPTTEEEEP